MFENISEKECSQRFLIIITFFMRRFCIFFLVFLFFSVIWVGEDVVLLVLCWIMWQCRVVVVMVMVVESCDFQSCLSTVGDQSNMLS